MIDSGNYVIKHGELTARQFIELWESVWDGAPSIEQVELALENTLFTVSIHDGGRCVAMARMIGDKGLFAITSRTLLSTLNIRGAGLAGRLLMSF